MTPAERDVRFLRSLLAASEDCIKVIALDGTLSFINEGGQKIMEVSDFNAIKGCPWASFWEGQGHLDAIASLEAARAGRSSRFQGPANTASGNPRYWDVQVAPILGADGNVESILSVSRDITNLKDAENRQRLLALELKHRMKNTIAMIQAIANQTLRGTPETEDAREAFKARLQTMSSAQDLLTQTAWSQAELGELVEAALKPHGVASRFETAGPHVELSSKCALALAMTLHELVTNATKYGALSQDGSVKVTWSVADGQFHFRWVESGGPLVSPPTRKGFGSRMIERALAGYFNGKPTIDYAPSGLVFTLDAPLDALTAE